MGRSRSWWRQLQLKNVEHIRATSSAFAAILQDGSVVAWGDRSAGGDSSRVQDQLKNVEHIQATSKAFAAILQDGSVIRWGDPQAGGRTCHRARNVQQVHFQMAPLRHGAIQCLATWTIRLRKCFRNHLAGELERPACHWHIDCVSHPLTREGVWEKIAFLHDSVSSWSEFLGMTVLSNMFSGSLPW